MNRLYDRSYFFDQGLRFKCKSCGTCCTGDPGIVYVGKSEVARIAKYLSVKVSSFIEKNLYPFRAGFSIREHSDGRCLFYKNECMIYPVRPCQCESFPFWFENVRSLKQWRLVSKECPGIGNGQMYSKEQILRIIHSNIDDVIKSNIKNEKILTTSNF